MITRLTCDKVELSNVISDLKESLEDHDKRSELEKNRLKKEVEFYKDALVENSKKLNQLNSDQRETIQSLNDKNESLKEENMKLKVDGEIFKKLEEENKILSNELTVVKSKMQQITTKRPSTSLTNEVQPKTLKSAPNLGIIKLVFT